MTIYGNDDSHWNGKRNYDIAKAKGARFNVSKASEGKTYQDDTFVSNYTAAKATFEINGAYHYFRPGVSASQQIVNLSTALKKIDWSPKSLLAVDYETADGQAPSVCIGRLKSFCKELRAMYTNPILIYTGPGIWASIGSKDDFWTQFDLFIANYGVPAPTIPAPWDRYAIWQFSATGTGPAWGASSPHIDIDIMSDWYWDQVVIPAPPPEPEPNPIIPEMLTGTVGDNTYTWRLE